MGRPRKGDGLKWVRERGWCIRVMVTVAGVKMRRTVALDTDRMIAEAKAKRLRAGESYESVLELDAAAAAPITVVDAAAAAYEQWQSDGIVEAPQRKSRLERYVFPHIGSRPVTAVRPKHISELLDKARAAGMKRETVGHIRKALIAVFDGLVHDEVVASNVASKSRMPKMRETKKQRAVLTDKEIATFLRSPVVDLEVKMLVLLSRTIGGMRAGALNALDWSMFSDDWRVCKVWRKKTNNYQPLEVPSPVRPFIAEWNRLLGDPKTGPVFPVRRGPRAGEFKKPGNMSYAERLRRELKRALGVATQDERGRWQERPQDTWSRREAELFVETATTMPLDFHSTRRAFVTALAQANVNSQTAQILAGHSDADAHQRYVEKSITALPEGAIPELDDDSLAGSEPNADPFGCCVPAESEVLTAQCGISSVGRASASQAPPLPTAPRNVAQSLHAHFRAERDSGGRGPVRKAACHTPSQTLELFSAELYSAATQTWDQYVAGVA